MFSASRRSRMCGTALAASSLLTVMRTSSEPARASSATCMAVPSTSAVSVLVMDCTTTGASEPIVTPPTRTWRVERRAAPRAASSANVVMRSLHFQTGNPAGGNMRSKIDLTAGVLQPRRTGIADDDGKGRLALHHALGAGGTDARIQASLPAVTHVDPGFFGKAEHQAPRISLRFGRRLLFRGGGFGLRDHGLHFAGAGALLGQ